MLGTRLKPNGKEETSVFAIYSHPNEKVKFVPHFLKTKIKIHTKWTSATNLNILQCNEEEMHYLPEQAMLVANNTFCFCFFFFLPEVEPSPSLAESLFATAFSSARAMASLKLWLKVGAGT